MDQALIAGVGNIYADEILFQARLHPHTPVTSLDARQRTELFRSAQKGAGEGDRVGAGAEQSLERLPDDYLLSHRDKHGNAPAAAVRSRPSRRPGGPAITVHAASAPRVDPALDSLAPSRAPGTGG